MMITEKQASYFLASKVPCSFGSREDLGVVLAYMFSMELQIVLLYSKTVRT
jgi:hypothetical protein